MVFHFATTLKLIVLGLLVVFSLDARSGDYERIQKMLPSLKGRVCDTPSTSDLFKPPSPAAGRFVLLVKDEDAAFKQECLSATTSAQIAIAGDRRAIACKRHCEEEKSWTDTYRQTCINACQQTGDGISVKATYFQMGIDAFTGAIQSGRVSCPNLLPGHSIGPQTVQ